MNMEKDKRNSSAYSVPETMQDMTINSTPLPQAASTAMKTIPLQNYYSHTDHSDSQIDELLESDHNVKQALARHQEQLVVNNPITSGIDKTTQKQILKSTYENILNTQREVDEEFTKLRYSKEKRNPRTTQASLSSWATKYNLQQSEEKSHSNFLSLDGDKLKGREDFEFRIPTLPVKKSGRSSDICGKQFKPSDRSNKSTFSTNASSITPLETGKASNQAVLSSNTSSLYPTELGMSNLCHSQRNKEDVPENLSFSLPYLEHCSSSRRIENHRDSWCSSANSSLGIISPDTLEGVKDKLLMEFTDKDKLDLSQRLAEELNLDTSNIKEGLDLSMLLSVDNNRSSATRSEEDKENWSRFETTVGNSSSTSQFMAKENSLKSISLNAGIKQPEKDFSFDSVPKPFSEWNPNPPRDSFLCKSTNRLSLMSGGNQSLGSNPFGDYSRVSVESEEFQSGEKMAEQLQCDEQAWLDTDDKRSLSGIYGDGNISIRTQGEKLSISSFLRSKSGPLGCLEKKENIQRPCFGRPVTSPEKKLKPKPILPPPEDKLTFCLSELQSEPTRDTDDGRETEKPWSVESLMEQYSVVHGDSSSGDGSYPSLSAIGAMLTDNVMARDLYDQLIGSKRIDKGKIKKEQKDASLVILEDSVLSNCVERSNIRNIASFVEGKKNFCRGNDSDRSTRYSSSFNSDLSLDENPVLICNNQLKEKPEPSVIIIDEATNPSICNVTDFEGDQDEFVCVLTPESMDFDIFNDSPRAQHYSIIKACYVDSRRRDSAALVHLPVSSLTLGPGEKRTVLVTVAPVEPGTIKIKLDVIRTDSVTKETDTNNVYGKIIAELPNVSIVSGPVIQMKPVVGSHSADLYGVFRGEMLLKNNALAVVPVKLSIVEVNGSDMEVFHFDRKNKRALTFAMKPGQTIKQTVYCYPPPVVKVEQSSGVSGKVEVQLLTPVEVQMPPLDSAEVRAQLVQNFYCAPTSLLLQPENTAPCNLYNSGLEPVTLHATTTAEFSVQPVMLHLQPRQPASLQVTHLGGSQRKGNLTLHAVESNHHINLQVLCRSGNNSYGVNPCTPAASPTPPTARPVASPPPPTARPTASPTTARPKLTPQSSRATSPTSPCSSVRSFGPQWKFVLTCTHKELVWGGCGLQQRAVKTCSLKNQSFHREKLLLKVTDSSTCFKILNEKNFVETEMKLSLQPMENMQISVVALPGSVGPKRGILTISRINSPADKKVLPLYAFGGKARVIIEGVLQDPEQHMWLYLDSDSLSNSFSLTNNGDAPAFVKIINDMSAAAVGGGISIAPPELILPPGQSASVEITLSVTPDRIEYLLTQPSQTAICITRLKVLNGDESTRMRLSRLSSTHSNLADKLTLLKQLLQASPLTDLHQLDDPSSCAEGLWQEDIKELNIGILVKRSALESIRLDTSVEFLELATTVFDLDRTN